MDENQTLTAGTATQQPVPDNLELILINISGHDRPGVTAALTAILAKYNAMILDIGQADIHHTLSLGILVRTTSDVSGDILKDLLFKAYDLGVKIRFTPVTAEEYRNWVNRQGKNRWIITLLGRRLTARHIASHLKKELSQGQRHASNSQCEAHPQTATRCRAGSFRFPRTKVSTFPCRKTPCTDAAAV